MRRLSIVGLCFVAMVAFGATVASSADAGEYGVCLKVKGFHHTGKWNDNACEVSRNVPDEGKFEWYPGLTGIGQPGVSKENFEFTSREGKAVLGSAAGRITCMKSTDEGEILGAQYNVETILFKECALTPAGAKKATGNCTGDGVAGLGEGEIVVYADTYLIDHGTTGSSGLEPRESEVWNAYFPSEGGPYYPYMTTFACEPGVVFRIGGHASAVVAAGKMHMSWRTEFGEGKGEQDLEGEYSENGGLTYEPTGPSVLTVHGTNTTRDKSKIDVRECNDAGAVSEGMGALPCEIEEPLPW
jgi:hypothetical protein